MDGVAEVAAEFWHPDTMIITYEAWVDGVSDMVANAPVPNIVFRPMRAEYDLKFHMLDTVFCNSSELYETITSGRMTDCFTFVLDRSAALLCGRKRWLQLENYAEPTRDLAGIVISCRQDSVTLYKDATCEIEES